MRVKVSIYVKDFETDQTKWVCSRVIDSTSIKELDDTLQLYDLFESETFLSPGLCFYDIYCFGIDNEVVERLKLIKDHNIPSSKEEKCKWGTWFWKEAFCPNETEFKVYPERPFVLYYEKRFERGASSFSSIVYWISEHPIAMIFIGGAIWDGVKKLFCKVCGKYDNASKKSQSKYYRFSFSRFYSHFSKAIGIDKSMFGIIEFKKVNNEKVFNLIVRTESDDLFAVKAKTTGRIITFQKK